MSRIKVRADLARQCRLASRLCARLTELRNDPDRYRIIAEEIDAHWETDGFPKPHPTYTVRFVKKWEAEHFKGIRYNVLKPLELIEMIKVGFDTLIRENRFHRSWVEIAQWLNDHGVYHKAKPKGEYEPWEAATASDSWSHYASAQDKLDYTEGKRMKRTPPLASDSQQLSLDTVDPAVETVQPSAAPIPSRSTPTRGRSREEAVEEYHRACRELARKLGVHSELPSDLEDRPPVMGEPSLHLRLEGVEMHCVPSQGDQRRMDAQIFYYGESFNQYPPRPLTDKLFAALVQGVTDTTPRSA